MAKRRKGPRGKSFAVHLPITRHSIDVSKKLSYHVAEVKSKIVENDEATSITDFKIYVETKRFDVVMHKFVSERELFEEGFESLEKAIERATEVAN